MKLGISVTRFSWPGPTAEIGPIVGRIARAADEMGVDSIWTMDHLFQISISGLPDESPMLEAYAALAYMAGQTSRVRLGTLVTAVPYRHPGMLVKAVTSLDVLSGGRMIFGVGAGMRSTEAALAHEAGGLGLPFLSLSERFGQLEEVVRLALQMWRGDEEPFAGRHYRLERPLNSPNSLQRPHPPIMIGGGGERMTLRLVARYADACNLFDIPGQFQDDIPRKLGVLAEHCRREGRDYDQIEKTTATLVDLSGDRREALDRMVEHLRDLAALGIDHAIISPREPWDGESLDALASVVGEIHAIPVVRAAA